MPTLAVASGMFCRIVKISSSIKSWIDSVTFLTKRDEEVSALCGQIKYCWKLQLLFFDYFKNRERWFLSNQFSAINQSCKLVFSFPWKSLCCRLYCLNLGPLNLTYESKLLRFNLLICQQLHFKDAFNISFTNISLSCAMVGTVLFILEEQASNAHPSGFKRPDYLL